MKKEIKISKGVIITSIINFILVLVITVLGRIITLNIMQGLESSSDMRSTYIEYYNISFMLLGILFIVALIINAKIFRKNRLNNESNISRSTFYNILVSLVPFLLPLIFWLI